MSRLEQRFARLRERDRAALVTFLTAGDPRPDATVPLLHDMVAAGADVLEIGIPFSDPMADGPVIQRASERALQHGVTIRDVLSMVTEFRRGDGATPVVLMGYLNPIEAMGYESFASTAAQAGVDGVIIVDLPPEEAGELDDYLQAAGIDSVYIVAPTTTEERLVTLGRAARGFLYYVSLRGVTGAGNLDLTEVETRLRAVKRHTQLPVGVGFGISTPEQARHVARFADAVIVGSAIIRRVEQGGDDLDAVRRGLEELVRSLRAAIDTARVRVASGS